MVSGIEQPKEDSTLSTDALIAGIQNQDLRFPEELYESVRRFTMTKQAEGERNRDNIPFERYVDIWWVSLCIGVQEGRRTKVDSKRWHTFVRAGEVLPSNPWRLFQLQLLALGESGSTDILSKPGELIAMANEYAATGLPILLEEIIGSQAPIWATTRFLEKRVATTE